MSEINDVELMHKIIIFGRRAQLGKPMQGKGHGPKPEGFHGPTDGCFHPGKEGGEHHPPMHHPQGGPGMRKPPLSREHILVLLSKYPEGVRQKVIADQAGINQSSASELIDKLEFTGYLKRLPDPNDKRATLLILTEKGQARAAEVEDERKDMIRDFFAPLSEEEKETLSLLLDKLLAERE